MRIPTSSTWLTLLLSTSVLAATSSKPGATETAAAKRTNSAKPASAQKADKASETPESTVFNGIEVPPMKQLNGEKFDEEISHGYWVVKHFSPYCHHCIAIAPTYQTLYEFYYTSSPVPSQPEAASNQPSLNSFERYYDFHFASLDCIAFGNVCDKNKIGSYPTFSLFKEGRLVKNFEGKKNLENLSHFVEESLESIRPGSRPKEGVKLPEVGAKRVDRKAKPDTALSKDKDAAAGVAAAEEHKERIAQAATKSGTTYAAGATEAVKKIPQRPAKQRRPSVTPNELGASVPLSAEAFQNLVTTTQDPWFIKFYAPWCHHCQAMAANWVELGREMKGKLNVGEVNCDAETRLCRDVHLKGYPTIIFFKGGERVEYDGLRGLGDFVNFANKAIEVGDGVPDVDAVEFKELEEKEEVLFLYFYDHATTTEDFEAIERVQLSLIGHARIVKTNSSILADRFKISTWPRLLVARDGRPTYYTALAPKDMRDFRKVLGWMQSVWLPIVPELTAANSREIMDGKYVVLGILSRDRPDEFASARREIKNAASEWMDKQTLAFQLERQELRDAKQLRIEEAEDRGDQRALRSAKSIKVKMDETSRKEVGFAWVDGVFWERWIKTTYGIDVREGEKVIINDETNRKYWDTTSAGGAIVPSRTSILETLSKVATSPPKLKAKSSTSRIESIFYEAREVSHGHPYMSAGLLVAVVIFLAVWGRGRIRRGKNAGGIRLNGSQHHHSQQRSGSGFFRLDGKEGLLSSVSGAVTGNGQGGKVD